MDGKTADGRAQEGTPATARLADTRASGGCAEVASPDGSVPDRSGCRCCTRCSCSTPRSAGVPGPAYLTAPRRGRRKMSVAALAVRHDLHHHTRLDAQLSEQLEWHWHQQLRPRFEGLTDDEYLWEPAQPAWNVRPRTGEGQPAPARSRSTSRSPSPTRRRSPPSPGGSRTSSSGAGRARGVALRRSRGRLRQLRVRGHGREALEQLDEAYARWTAGVHGLDARARAPCGSAEGPFATTRWPRSCCTSTGR
jgi:hypothetical protein